MSPISTSPPSDRRHASSFVRAMRKVYHPLGFSKGYNFPLFVIFGGAMIGFVLARFSYLNFSGDAPSSFKNGSSPGEYYHYRTGHYRVGIILHLAACLPAGLLMVFQFVPMIRWKALMIHRINGYVILLLTLISNAGALMICRVSFGGGLDTQMAVGLLVILTTVSIAMAYYNIKRLQIDQHRAWMLRFAFYMGTIITTRLIMIISALIISKIGTFYQIRSCGELAYIYREMPNRLESLYPQCVAAGASSALQVIVKASFGNQPEQIGVSLGIAFGPAVWLAIFLHLVGVEIYLHLTSAESERLRSVSYERQVEKGFAHPGSSGLTSDRWGDVAPWTPPSPLNK